MTDKIKGKMRVLHRRFEILKQMYSSVMVGLTLKRGSLNTDEISSKKKQIDQSKYGVSVNEKTITEDDLQLPNQDP